MSELKPLMELVREWRKQGNEWKSSAVPIHTDKAKAYIQCADELEAKLRAWTASFSQDLSSDIPVEYVREKLLGVPAK